MEMVDLILEMNELKGRNSSICFFVSVKLVKKKTGVCEVREKHMTFSFLQFLFGCSSTYILLMSRNACNFIAPAG